jgi:hypothetical protein
MKTREHIDDVRKNRHAVRTTRTALVVAATLGTGAAGCGGDDHTQGATVAVTVQAATVGGGMMLQLERPGEYTLSGTARPLLAPAVDPAGAPRVTGLDVEIMALDASDAEVARVHFAMAAPPGVRPDDVWFGIAAVLAHDGAPARATLVLARPGETPPTRVDEMFECGSSAPSIVGAWIAPTPVLPGRGLMVYLLATDQDGPPEDLTVTAGFGDQAVPLQLVATRGTTGTWTGTVTAPLAEGECFVTLRAKDAGGAEAVDFEFAHVGEGEGRMLAAKGSRAFDAGTWDYTWLTELGSVGSSGSGWTERPLHACTIAQDEDGTCAVSISRAILRQPADREVILKVYDAGSGALLYEQPIALDSGGSGSFDYELGSARALPEKVKVGLSFRAPTH